MSLQGIRSPHRSRLDLEHTIGSDIPVSSPQDYADEITGMVVEETPVIRLDPMMKANRESEDDQGPAMKVWTLRPSETIITQLERRPESPVLHHL